MKIVISNRKLCLIFLCVLAGIAIISGTYFLLKERQNRIQNDYPNKNISEAEESTIGYKGYYSTNGFSISENKVVNTLVFTDVEIIKQEISESQITLKLNIRSFDKHISISVSQQSFFLIEDLAKKTPAKIVISGNITETLVKNNYQAVFMYSTNQDQITQSEIIKLCSISDLNQNISMAMFCERMNEDSTFEYLPSIEFTENQVITDDSFFNNLIFVGFINQ